MGSFVSSVGDLFGANSSANSANTVAQAAPLIQPVTAGQVNQANTTEQDLINALSGNNGTGNQNQIFNEGQQLNSQLGNIAAGNGPNPALAELNQATGQNIANQTALAAGQRGVGNNVGLLERQIGQQGAGIQQQAAGQVATLQAQQELAALGQEAGVQNNLANLANTQVGQQIGATGQNQNSLLSALQGYNANQVSNVASQNSANAGIAQTNANNTAKTISNVAPAVGQAMSMFAGGGEAEGILAKALSKKMMPDHLRSMAEIYHPKILKKADGGQVNFPIDQAIPNASPIKDSSDDSSEGDSGGAGGLGAILAFLNEGAVVPGEPKVPAKNTVKNDVVPAMLTPKEIVLPLSVTQSKNPGEAAKAFVEKIKGKDRGSDFKQALRDHVKNRKSK